MYLTSTLDSLDSKNSLPIIYQFDNSLTINFYPCTLTDINDSVLGLLYLKCCSIENCETNTIPLSFKNSSTSSMTMNYIPLSKLLLKLYPALLFTWIYSIVVMVCLLMSHYLNKNLSLPLITGFPCLSSSLVISQMHIVWKLITLQLNY